MDTFTPASEPAGEPTDPHAGQHPSTPAHPSSPSPWAGYGPATYGTAQQGQQYPYWYGYGHPYAAPPAPPRRSRRLRHTLLGLGAAASPRAWSPSGVAIGDATRSTSTASGTGSLGTGSLGTGSSGTGSSGTGFGGLGGFGGSSAGSGSTGSGSAGTGSAGSGTAATATATQQKGIVTVVSVLKYQNAESAGTGLILTSDGEILTNNHVIDGATSVTVTVESTGTQYRADVVGTDATDDVAVLKLRNASGLTTAKVGDANDLKDLSAGDKVTGVGNAGGTGTLTAAAGTVTALGQTITASDDSGTNAETLHGLIQTDAPIQAGDSGGPLYDSDGTIVGIDTAASTGPSTMSVGSTAVASQAYAIPITTALSIAEQIESGTETSSIHIGLPAFLGVGLSGDDASGATVGSVVSGGPADTAGIAAGDTITAVGGTTVTSASSLQSAIAAHQPGEKVSVSWTDTTGQSHTGSVTLGTGPAD